MYLNMYRVLRNKDFSYISLFDRKKIISMLVLSFVSIAVLVSFHLITQFYVLYLFRSELFTLFFFTGLFGLLFLGKLGIDISIERYKVKYYAKIEKRIKELVYAKYKDKSKEKRHYYTRYIHLYILLLKTVHGNMLDMVKVALTLIIIIMYAQYLIVFVVVCIPFFVLFYALIRKKAQDEVLHYKDFFEVEDTQVRKALQQEFEAKYHNKAKYVTINQVMVSFVSFFRLFFLAYFGYYFITSDIHVVGIIVGLLYITILLRPLLNIIKSQQYYYICERAFFKIHGLLK